MQNSLFVNALNKLNDDEIIRSMLTSTYDTNDPTKIDNELKRINEVRGSHMVIKYGKIPTVLEECFEILVNRKKFSPDPYLECSLELGLITRDMMENHGLDNHKWSANDMMENILGGTKALDCSYIDPRTLSNPSYSIKTSNNEPISLGTWFYEVIKLSKSVVNENARGNPLDAKSHDYVGMCDYQFICDIIKLNNYIIELADKLAKRWFKRFMKQFLTYNKDNYRSIVRHGLKVDGVMEMLRAEFDRGKIDKITSGNMNWKYT